MTEIDLNLIFILEHRPSKHKKKKSKKNQRVPAKKVTAPSLVVHTKVPTSCYTSVDVIITKNIILTYTILTLLYLGLSDMDC